ncbi:hypothetical protein, partial [Blastopirellula marina]
MTTILRNMPPVLIVLLVTFLPSGCTTEVADTDHAPLAETPKFAPPTAVTPAAAEKKPAGEVIREQWSAVIQQGRKIGASHETTSRVQQGDRELIESVSTEKIAMRRQQNTIEMIVINRFLETPEGQLVSYETTIEQGGVRSAFAGQVSADGKQLTVTTTAGGKSVSAPIPWKPEWGGVYAAAQLLENPPIE